MCFQIQRKKVMINLQRQLFEMQDLKYRDFQAGLLPTLDKERIIGIRMPQLRKFAKTYGKNEKTNDFMMQLPHYYYEENNLHGLLIDQIKDYEICLDRLEAFLPYIDNWATCDMLTVPVVKNNLDGFVANICRWIESGHSYTMRFSISMLMKYYLEEKFKPEYPEMVANVESEEYYVNMMRAWYFATALAKRYDDILPYLTEYRLDTWTHNKTIQKAVESYRITQEQKGYLRTLRVRKK